MLPDTLYDLVFRFKKTRLWKTLYDSQLFAVRCADNKIGYCCVMGMLGEHLALAVYPGDEGMDSYRLMGKDRSMMDYLEAQETILSQNCVMVSFENKAELRPREIEGAYAYCTSHRLTLRGRKAFPHFQRFRPHYFPWYVDAADDQALLAQALEAAIEVSKKLLTCTPEALGFTEGEPYDRTIPLLEKKDGAFLWSEIALPKPRPVCFPSPDIQDDLSLAKLKRIDKRGGEWACDIFMHVDPVSDEDGEVVDEPQNAPFFPYLLLVVDNKSGIVLGMQVSQNPEDYAEEFTRTVLEVVQKSGKPTRILVCNERAHAFFAKLAVSIGTKLVKKQQIPFLEEAKESFVGHFADEEGEPGDALEQLMELLRDPRAFGEMPDEMLIYLSQVVELGMLPEDIADRVLRECKSRGMR